MTNPGLRVGLGVDVHRFCLDSTPRPAMLAGLSWPGETPLEGHSDGDVVAHAIVDAIASAAGLGDIGTLFGTSDPTRSDAPGATFLSETRHEATKAGYAIVHVSVVVIGNRPRLAPRRQEAEMALSSALGGAPVTLTATTTDGLGLTGRGEGLAAIATALLQAPPPGRATRATTSCAGS